MSKYANKQIEMFKRIDPSWEEGANRCFRFDCLQIEPGHGFNYCQCQCVGCGKIPTTNRYEDDEWVQWDFYDCYPHYNNARCETPYCCYYYKFFNTKNELKYPKESNYVRSNKQKPIKTSRKKKTVWKKLQ